MDDRIRAVLDIYHARIAREAGEPGGIPAADVVDTRMRAVGPATGQFIQILAQSLKAPTILEIGTSYGYSGIWLAAAARETGGRLITVELYDYKSSYAREMAEKAGLSDYVDFRTGDALEIIAGLGCGIDFVLLDLWKDLYLPCFEAFYPKLNPGAIIVADNMRKENEAIRLYGRAVRAAPGIASVALPVGSGIEVSRFEPDGPGYAPRP